MAGLIDGQDVAYWHAQAKEKEGELAEVLTSSAELEAMLEQEVSIAQASVHKRWQTHSKYLLYMAHTVI